ncbi:uncharacterized protein LOC144694507 [Cetorhinus maximus]
MNSLISDSLDPLQIEGDEEESFEKGCEQLLLSPGETDESGFFEGLISDRIGEAKLPTGTEPLIATESDIDLTAQLVPSGGLQNHLCVTSLPVSETRLQTDCIFEYAFPCGTRVYTEGPIHSIRHSDYKIPHSPAGHHSSKALCEETPNRGSSHVKSLASSTIPFSLGTSPKPGLVKGNLIAGNLQGPIGRLNGVIPDRTVERDDRMLVKVPTFETDSRQNENFNIEPERVGTFSAVPKSEGWMVSTNEEDLYCEACSCDEGSVDLYTDPSQKRDEPTGRTEEANEPQQSASVFFGNSALPESRPHNDSASRPMEETFHPAQPGTASSPREHRMSQKEVVLKKKKRRKKKQKDGQPLSDLFIRKSIELAYLRIRRELTAQVLDALREIYIEGFLENGQFFDLLDSGLVLSNQEREYFMDRVIVTMQDGARLALSPAEHGNVSYYRPFVEFHCVQQLGNNWFRVKDKTTGQLVLMKKVTVMSDWQKGLWNFLTLQPESVVLVPYAVICDRKGSILYLTQDRGVTGFGRPRGVAFDHRKIFERCVSFLHFCWHCGLHPGDFNSNIVYSRENIYFDPTSLTGLEDQYTFNKSLKAAYSLIFETGCQDLSFDSFLDIMWCSGEERDTGSERRRLLPVCPGVPQDPVNAQGFGD